MVRGAGTGDMVKLSYKPICHRSKEQVFVRPPKTACALHSLQSVTLSHDITVFLESSAGRCKLWENAVSFGKQNGAADAAQKSTGAADAMRAGKGRVAGRVSRG